MNAVYKAHLHTLSYSRKLVITRVKREPPRFNRLQSICNELLLIPSSSHQTLSRLIMPSCGHVRSIQLLADDDKCDISANEIRRIVKSRLRGYKEGFTCVAVDCPSCSKLSSQESKNDLGKLYINLRTGYAFCSQCFLQGPWSSLNSYLKALETCNLKSEKPTSNKGTDI